MFRNRVEKTDHPGCCALVSLVSSIHILILNIILKNNISTVIFCPDQSVGKSLTFRGTVFEASHLIKSHKCADPVCDTQLLRVDDLSLSIVVLLICLIKTSFTVFPNYFIGH